MSEEARVEAYRAGAWKFYCVCGHQDMQNWRESGGASRIVTDSEVNFRCERPIIDATDTHCMKTWHLPTLIQAYQERKKKSDALAYLKKVDEKKREALLALGIEEGDLKGNIVTVTTSGGVVLTPKPKEA